MINTLELHDLITQQTHAAQDSSSQEKTHLEVELVVVLAVLRERAVITVPGGLW